MARSILLLPIVESASREVRRTVAQSAAYQHLKMAYELQVEIEIDQAWKEKAECKRLSDREDAHLTFVTYGDEGLNIQRFLDEE